MPHVRPAEFHDRERLFSRSWPWRMLAVVLILAGFSSLTSLGSAPLLDWDENMQSEVARQISVRGDLLQLTLNGQAFTEKPPLFFLEMAGFFKVFGVSEATARATTALNGLVFLAALFWIARYLVDTEFAALWTLLYASSLLPLIFSRAAVVEHTFNSLMALGAVTLVAYDRSYGQWRVSRRGAQHASRWPHWGWLLAASMALGLAVLAKGPSGGAVPLVAFAGYKATTFLDRQSNAAGSRTHRAPLNPLHWVVCGVLSLAIALSWYVANYLAHGGAFVREFARFMGLLFSRSLEGHSGPFYYHWAAALLGLFPWTPLLLLFALPAVRRSIAATSQGTALVGFGVVWAGFILIVFSLVQTKLPHYSSGMYVPLTLLAAIALRQSADEKVGRVPGWICGLMAGYGLAIAVLFAVIPYRMSALAETGGAGLNPPPTVPQLAWVPGLVLGCGVAVGAAFLAKGFRLIAVTLVAATMGAFIVGVWRIHLPLVAAYNQGPMIALMEEAYAAGGDLALYEDVSYAALFYGRRDVDMIGTYKFTGDPARLDTPGSRPLYVITSKSREARLLSEHPQLKPVRDLGTLAMLRLPATGEAGRKR